MSPETASGGTDAPETAPTGPMSAPETASSGTGTP